MSGPNDVPSLLYVLLMLLFWWYINMRFVAAAYSIADALHHIASRLPGPPEGASGPGDLRR
jgi:hypothetical protein